jgi:hypothetical protein
MSVIDSLLSIAGKALDYAQLKESKKYLDRVTAIRVAILHERIKGDQADDARIEEWIQEMNIAQDALEKQVVLEIAAGSK